MYPELPSITYSAKVSSAEQEESTGLLAAIDIQNPTAETGAYMVRHHSQAFYPPSNVRINDGSAYHKIIDSATTAAKQASAAISNNIRLNINNNNNNNSSGGAITPSPTREIEEEEQGLMMHELKRDNFPELHTQNIVPVKGVDLDVADAHLVTDLISENARLMEELDKLKANSTVSSAYAYMRTVYIKKSTPSLFIYISYA